MTDALPKILFIDHTSELGGAERSLLTVVQGVRDSGQYEPLVATTLPNPDNIEGTTSEGFHQSLVTELERLQIGCRLFDLPERTRHLPREATARNPKMMLAALQDVLKALIQLVQLVLREKIRLVHTNTLKSHFLGTLVARATGKPVVWHLRDLPSHRGDTRGLLNQLSWIKRPAAIICISQAVRDDLPPRLQKVAHVIYNGLDVESHTRPVNQERLEAIRHAWKLTSEHQIIGTVGYFIPWKGQRDLLTAMAGLTKEFPDLRLVLVGEGIFQFGGEREVLEQQAKALGIQDRVIFAGYQGMVLDWLDLMDVFILPSHREPLGRVAIEAMFRGKPVIGTNAGGVPEVVADGETGLLYPVGDVTALTKGIQSLLRDPEQAQRLGEAGHSRAMEKFSATRLIAELLSYYEQLV